MNPGHTIIIKRILCSKEQSKGTWKLSEKPFRILKEDPAFPIENAKRIIGLRNQIIHGYDSISDENIWGIITVYLPKLKSEIDTMIKE
jgi:uncharacterized protein YutE (UPF0331/DUF86 family)